MTGSYNTVKVKPDPCGASWRLQMHGRVQVLYRERHHDCSQMQQWAYKQDAYDHDRAIRRCTDQFAR